MIDSLPPLPHPIVFNAVFMSSARLLSPSLPREAANATLAHRSSEFLHPRAKIARPVVDWLSHYRPQ